MTILSDADGEIAVREARRAAEAETVGEDYEPSLPSSFDEPRGVFVTINEHPSGILRGCIGYVEPRFPLSKGLAAAARGVCHDPRFPQLMRRQAEKGVFEVTVLTAPEEIPCKGPEDLKSRIRVGTDGLMLRYDGYVNRPVGAVFLPQVPVEQGWDVEEYLENLCYKAGLQGDAWMADGMRFWRFQGEAFAEESPNGPVKRVRACPTSSSAAGRTSAGS